MIVRENGEEEGGDVGKMIPYNCLHVIIIGLHCFWMTTGVVPELKTNCSASYNNTEHNHDFEGVCQSATNAKDKRNATNAKDKRNANSKVH